MARLAAYPYLRAGNGVTLREFTVASPPFREDSGVLVLEGWDPGTDVQVLATVAVDPAGLRASCGLPEDACLDLVAVWRSPGTALAGCGTPEPVPPAAGECELAVAVGIPGHRIGREVRVEIRLVLARSLDAPGALHASRAGQILWNEERVIRLEDGGSRFPLETVDFTALSSLPDGAAWYLDLETRDLEAPAHGHLRLLVNTAHAALREALVDGGASPASAAMLSAMEWDVARSLILAGIRQSDFHRDPDGFPPGSVGASLRAVFTVVLGEGMTVTEAAARWNQSPEYFEAMLQHGIGLFRNDGS